MLFLLEKEAKAAFPDWKIKKICSSQSMVKVPEIPEAQKAFRQLGLKQKDQDEKGFFKNLHKNSFCFLGQRRGACKKKYLGKKKKKNPWKNIP